jgi:hypothetical protein
MTRRTLLEGPFLMAVCFAAGCSSTPLPEVHFAPRSDLSFRTDDLPFLPGLLGVIPLRDRRGLPFHGQRNEEDEAWFRRSAVLDLDEAVRETLLAGGLAESQVDLPGEEPLLEPGPDRLRDFARRHPDVDYVLSGEVDLLNVTTRCLGSSDVKVGEKVYEDVAYFGHRLRVRARLELYSLRYNLLLWGDVVEGAALEPEGLESVVPLAKKAFDRLARELHASLYRSGTRVRRVPGGELDFEPPSHKALCLVTSKKMRLAQEALVRDGLEVKEKGPGGAVRAAVAEHRRKIRNVEGGKAFAQILSALATQAAENPQEVETIDLTSFDEQLRELGDAEGSTVLSSDPDSLERELVVYNPTVPLPPDKRVTLLGAEFRHVPTPTLDLLSQVGESATSQIAIMGDRILEAYRKEYVDRDPRPGLKEQLLDPDNRPLILVFRGRDAFAAFCNGFDEDLAKSGGFYQYLDDDHAVWRALQEPRTELSGRRAMIATYYYDHADAEGDPLAGIDVLWGTLPHELGHHVHDLLLAYAVPPFQSDGFAIYHEYPVDFGGFIRFGQFQNPGNERYLAFLERGNEPISLLDIVHMDYLEISRSGASLTGYASVWLYYQFMKSRRREELRAFELALAKERPTDLQEMGQLFVEKVVQGDPARLPALEREAREWLAEQSITESELQKSAESLSAIRDGLARSYNYRRRVPARLPH